MAAAVTYCVPAVDGASDGPDSDTVGGWLSTQTVFEMLAETPAASAAFSVSRSAPCPYVLVSIVWSTGGAAH